MGSARRVLALLLPLALLSATLTAPAADASSPRPGSRYGGDPYFPRQGNGGYDVGSYTLAIRYTPATKHLVGVATIRARSTQALSRFDLDLRRNLQVSSVRVDGRAAAFVQPAKLVQELVVTPGRVIANGHTFTVVVRYAGTAKPITDPDGSLDGFITTGDGAFVASEPQGSPTWFPVNNIPRDKATYRVSITVPRGLKAVSNGRLVGVTRYAKTTTWRWALATPVSDYLITATIGNFTVRTGRTPSGIPYYLAVAPQEKQAFTVLRKLPAIVEYFSSVFGPYPFAQTGAIVDHAHKVGYALETASRPLFDRSPSVQTLSHELAHQWFGDGVSVRKWRDIWLNEGFAEFSSWLWDEHAGIKTAARHLDELLAIPASNKDEWNPPPGRPGSAKQMFADSVYDRGAGTLQALREKLGDPTYFRILRGWVAAHRQGNATVAQFTAYASRVAHRDLTSFFRTWLYEPGKPKV
ncbi:M1 family metallopeptidase [uncultured Jatrophihabitans sp.]|uniref:M1 family metallopeptidase n=1 Tax=uncultured Jatrophihabitans sp. TaxID=1610747 RepID=UPI0035CAEA17